MQNFKVPGVLWIVLLVTIVAGAHYYLDDPFIVDLVVVVVGMVLKSFKLGTEQENQAIDLINTIKNHPRLNRPVVVATNVPGPQMRGSGESSVAVETVVFDEPPVFPDPPPRPNKAMRWLVG